MTELNPLPDVDLEYLRKRKRDSTQRLLGETIAISDDDWQNPSLLPGWTRAHVAAHISRGADALRHLINESKTTPVAVYQPTRPSDIERGSERSALDLQIDLDTSAGKLNAAFDSLDEEQWSNKVQLTPSQIVPLSVLPLARLAEVEMHRVDLNYEYRVESIDPLVAGWLLKWYALCLAEDPTELQFRLRCDDGLDIDVGNGSGPRVSGTVHALLGWLTGRVPDSPVSGVGPRKILL